MTAKAQAAIEDRNRAAVERLRALGARLLIPPLTAFQDCLAAAAEVDALIGSLKADVVSEVLQARRERLLDRSLHRREHLDTLETAFPDIT